MIYSNLHQLLNTEFNITYLSSSAMNILDRKPEYVCHKGMRPYSRFFYIVKGETFFTFCKSGISKTVKAVKNDIVYLPDDIEYTSTWTNLNEINHISLEFCLRTSKNEPVLLSDEIFIVSQDSYSTFLPEFEKINKEWTAGALG